MSSAKANNVVPLYKRLFVFTIGMPGYVLTFLPWIIVITLITMLSVSYSNDGTFTIPLQEIPYQTQQNSLMEITVLILFSFTTWMFVAWFTKRILLLVARFFGGTEKAWQITKLISLLLGWIIVLTIAGIFFVDLSFGSILSVLVLVGVGVTSVTSEYFLGRKLL